jgi:hypothetical protein
LELRDNFAWIGASPAAETLRARAAQAEVIYQGLFDRLMQNEEAIGIDPAGLKCEPLRHMRSM